MDWSLLTTNSILLFILLVARLSGMMMSTSFFNRAGVPSPVKVWLSVLMAFILFPIFAVKAPLVATDIWAFLALAVQEFVLGLLIGFAADLFFGAVQLAGSFVTTQTGLSAAVMLDPTNNKQEPVFIQLYLILAVTLFMNLNLHHTLILAVAKSFETIPLATGFSNIGILAERFTAMGSDMFSLGVMLVLPVFGSMLILDAALAFMAKMMPQMNVFMVAMPLKILAGLILIIMTLPFTATAMTHGMESLSKHLMFLYGR